MSFYTDVESNPKMNQLTHVPKNIREMTADKGTIQYKTVLPPMCYFGGIQRVKPQSSFNTTNLFTSGSQLDYWLSFNGFLEQLRLELKLEVNSLAANPLTIVGPYLIDRIELYDTNQNIMQTIYADCLFLQRINYSNDKSKFENNAESVNNITYLGISGIAASAKVNLNLNIPCALTDAQLKGNIIDGRILVRVYFSANGVTSGAATDLYCNSADIIAHCEQLSGSLESREVLKKKSSNLHYRVLNPVRVASHVISNAQPSSQYDIQLVSGTQLSAYLMFIVRPSPINSTNIQSLVQGLTFEMYDASMTLVGITQTPESNRYIVGQKFGGDILNSSLGGGIYLLPFSINPHKSHMGNQEGFYQLTQKEVIRIYTTSTLAPGNYIVDIYSLDYAEMISDKGRLDFKK